MIRSSGIGIWLTHKAEMEVSKRMHFDVQIFGLDLICIYIWLKLRDWNTTITIEFLKPNLIFQIISNSCISIKFSVSSNSLQHIFESELHKRFLWLDRLNKFSSFVYRAAAKTWVTKSACDMPACITCILWQLLRGLNISYWIHHSTHISKKNK